MNEYLNKLLELIDFVKAATNKYDEVELLGNKESFDKLTELGFDFNNVRHQEIQFFDESKIFILPVKPKQIKVYFVGDE